MAIENAKFGKGIALAGGFDLGAKAPLDSRDTVATIEERDAHVTGNRAYDGMLVYVEADQVTYQYVNGEWKPFGFNLSDFQSEVVDNLTSDDSAKALSAKQGKVLKGLIDAETEARETAIEGAKNYVLEGLADEIERAKAAEGVNAAAIEAEVNRATEAEGVLTTAIATEKERALAAEGVNAQAIADEKARAEAAEGANAQAIATEKERALAAEGVLTTNLANYIASNNEALADEIARADAAEKANAAAIKVITDDYLKNADKVELANATAEAQSVADAAKAAIDAFLLDADTSGKAVDTLKEIQAFLDSGEVSAADLLAEINALKEIDNATQDELNTALEVVNASIATKAAASDVTAIDGRVAVLEGASATHATKTELATVKTDAETDATNKANAAQAAAEATAAADATAKVDAALVAAKADAKTKADAALETAKADATTKANAAETNAVKTVKEFYKAGLGLTLAEDGTFAIDTDLVFILDANA